ncbi:MAG TPA: TIM barrel protein [Thermomicrobiales bacterium]|nr:TIM barrel protein [Thermomicrobiales bacterium]
MPKIAANLSMLFTEYPFLERFDRAAAAGFDGVEFLFPYEEQASDIIDRLQENNLALVLFNLPAGDWAAGDRGIAAIYDRREEFRAGVAKAVEYATALRPPRLNCLAGKAEESAENDLALLQNVRYAAEQLAAIDVDLTVEPVNTHDVPGFALPTTRAALDLIAEVEQPNLGLQFDVYHSLRMGEDPIELIRELGADMAHIQIADVPGRHQPGTGKIDFEELFRTIDDSGYDGWVSLEYNPQGRTEDGFGLLRDMGLLE